MNDILPAEITSPSQVPIQKWDPRLVLDLAIAIDSLDEILLRYNLNRADYNDLMRNVVFKTELAATMRDVRENGLSFAAKSRVQAESYLPILDEIMYDRDVAANTKLSIAQSVVRWGRLEPKEDRNKEAEGKVVNPINIQINI